MSARRTLAALIAMLACAAPAAAQQGVTGNVTMRADRAQVGVGDMFHLEIRADVTGASNVQMELPELDAFDVLGRQVSTPMQFRFGFGNQAQVIQSTTIHRLTLRAREPGTFALRPAAALAGTQRFESNPVTIQVGGGGAPLGPDPQPDPSRTTAPGSGIDASTFDPNGFVRTVADPSDPYVGQQVTVTVYLYTRQPVQGGLTITHEPTTDGFWVHDLLPPTRTLEGQRQDVNGIPFNVYVLRRLAAFPLRAGSLTIGATSVSVTTGGIFDIFSPAPSAPLTRTGVPLTIPVRELPSAGRPRAEPHVGSLELAASLDRTQVATGDAVQLTLTARGVGQLRQLAVPGPRGAGLRVLQPEINDQVSSPRDVVGGSRVFRWLIVPERAGTFDLGPFEIPVLDPRTGTYSVARADALRLTAAGNATAQDEPDTTDARPREGAREGSPLGPIRTRSELSRSRARLVDVPWIAWSFAIGPLFLLAALLARVARRRGPAPGMPAPKQAGRDARRRLASAAKHAGAGEPREFYSAVTQALKEVLEAKLGRAVGSLTHSELRRLLVERGMHDELADRFVDELEGCDFARFSAAGVRADEMQGCLGRSRGLLEELERFTPRPEDAA